jgi:hypothetical protein
VPPRDAPENLSDQERVLHPANVLVPAGDDDLGVLDDSGAIDEASQGGTDTLADPDDDPDP